ncbi:hypothetical protein [Luteococcus peritonei]|uniref:Uncharacterized protein n=1 Tax=Luteococcus peritonei TaxID=88874 RepID=A0ABW4RUC7_9ACTN
MTVIKTLWASVMNSPSLMRRLNGWLTVFWVPMIPISYWMHWLDSVIYVSALSLWALVSGHWSAWQAARVEVRQEEEMRAAADHDLPGEIVDRLVRETDVDPSPTGSPAVPGVACPTCGHRLTADARGRGPAVPWHRPRLGWRACSR